MYLKTAAAIFEATTWIGIVGCHPPIPQDLTDSLRGRIVAFLERVQITRVWQTSANTALFFLLPNNVIVEMPVALLPT